MDKINKAEPIVETVEGKVRGVVRKNLDDEDFFSFFSIPYAKPALGDLRFKAPEPLEPWTGVKDATKERPRFYQTDIFLKTTSGTEDALHLNVFAKNINSSSSKLHPVMVWIHGGGFLEGSNSVELFGPEYLLTEDVVLVAINYRLGVLGFLQFEDPSLEVFGNAGMKDQVTALKWVQRNIKKFGGDPNNVTIFGESAGGASVNHLTMSPATKGLFHKAICQSGVVTNNWAVGRAFAKELLAHVGKEDLSEKEALEYLRSLTVEEIYRIQVEFSKSTPNIGLGTLGPVVEKPNATAFITKHPLEYLMTGDYNKIPIIIGYNSHECIFLKAENMDDNEAMKQMNLITYESVICKVLNVDQNSDVCKKFCSKLKDVYGEPNEGRVLFVSDLLFVMGAISSARHHSKTSKEPTYLYRMSLDAGLNVMKKMGKVKAAGASHADDVGYLFKIAQLPLVRGSAEEEYVRRFVKLWTNFAKYGNPTPPENDLGLTWKPFDEDTQEYLNIDRELTSENKPEKDRVNLWKEIYQANSMTANLL